MSTTRRPSKAVYRRRRLTLLLICVAVVALVVWGASALVGGADGDADAQSAAPSPTATAPSPVTSTAAASTPAPPTPTGPSQCAAPELVVAAVLDAQNYAPDAQPQLSLTITNTGAQPCIMNVGTAAQVYTISSGADTIWVSTHCQTEPVDEVVTIGAGQAVTAPPITWVRERSAPETCGSERPAAIAGGAYYQVVASVDGIASSPATFVLD